MRGCWQALRVQVMLSCARLQLVRRYWQHWITACVRRLSRQEAELLLHHFLHKHLKIGGMWALMLNHSVKKRFRSLECVLSEKRASRNVLIVLCTWCEEAGSGKKERESTCELVLRRRCTFTKRCHVRRWRGSASSSSAARRAAHLRLSALQRRRNLEILHVVVTAARAWLAGV